MNNDYDTLCADLDSFNSDEYLAFLSKRVPPDLAVQLTHDAHPELVLEENVEVSDLMKPLSEGFFPSDSDLASARISRLAGILEYTLSGYALDLRECANHEDSYKHAYVASFYLYCCLHGAKRCREYVTALLVLVKATAQLSLEGRLQVSRFVGSLIPMVSEASIADPTPLSSICIASSLILASTIEDLSVITEQAMHDEGFGPAWTREEQESEEGYLSLDSMKVLRNITQSFIGTSGKLEQIAHRLWEAVEIYGVPREEQRDKPQADGRGGSANGE